MAATPFSVYASFVNVSTGKQFNINLAGSDVANAYLTDPSGNAFVQLPNDGVYKLKDAIFSASGVDTLKLGILVNGRSTPEVILDSANLGSVFNRQITSMNLMFASGANIKFQQLA